MDDEEKQDDSESDELTQTTSKESTKARNLEMPTAMNNNATPPKSETIKSDFIKKTPKQQLEPITDLEWKRNVQYFLAEAASAPKHLVRYNSQEQFTKLINAYTEQGTTTLDKQLSDEPSCSVLPTTKEMNFVEGVNNFGEKEETTKILKILNNNIECCAEVVKPPAIGSIKQTDIRLPLESSTDVEPTPAPSVRSIGSLVCRICHNSENPERLVSPCLCKGSLSFVHIHCLERWISTSRSTVCELCQFQYNTEQTLRYTCIQSLRMWYSRSMSRRALQEDCQMFSLLTLVAFGIIGTLLVGIQYYFIQGRHWGLSSMWTKGWLLFFLFTTLLVYFINIYMIVRSQLAPWYRWWQSARDIKLILENRKPFKILPGRRVQRTSRQLVSQAISEQQSQPQSPPQPQPQPQPTTPSPNLPQIVPSAVHSQAASCILTAIPSMHNKTPTTNAVNVSQHGNSGKPDAKTMIPLLATTTSSNLNKLQISAELTTTTPPPPPTTEIIETSLEDCDRCAFEYVTAIV